MFNATFSNISVISWRPVLVVEEAGVPGENHGDPGQATSKLYHLRLQVECTLFVIYKAGQIKNFLTQIKNRNRRSKIPGKEKITGVKLMTVTAITGIPRWRTWNQVRMFFVD